MTIKHIDPTPSVSCPIPEGEEAPEKKLSQSTTKLSTIQKSIDTLIDAIVQNPSIFSRLASYWGKIPLWQKIVAGVVIAAPLITLAFLTQSIAMYVVTVFSILSYLGASTLLDDHEHHTQYSTAQIKASVTHLAEGLESIINELNLIGDGLAKQVALFTEENGLFDANVDDLKGQNDALKREVIRLRAIEKKLLVTQQGLEQTCLGLNKAIGEQSSLLDATQAELNKITADYAINQKLLAQKTARLAEVEEQFRGEVDHYKKLLETLEGAITLMKSTISDEETSDEHFIGRIDKMVSDKTEQFTKSLKRIMDLEHELARKKDEFAKATRRFQELVQNQQSVMPRLEKRLTRMTEALLAHGIYCSPDELSPQSSALRPAFN